jgi:hypothetical protein
MTKELSLEPSVLLEIFILENSVKGKDVCGSGCIDPHFLDLDTSWR